MQSNVSKNEFVRYEEGAKRYSMCKHTFMKLAQDAHAVYKINLFPLYIMYIKNSIIFLIYTFSIFPTVLNSCYTLNNSKYSSNTLVFTSVNRLILYTA